MRVVDKLGDMAWTLVQHVLVAALRRLERRYK